MTYPIERLDPSTLNIFKGPLAEQSATFQDVLDAAFRRAREKGFTASYIYTTFSSTTLFVTDMPVFLTRSPKTENSKFSQMVLEDGGSLPLTFPYNIFGFTLIPKPEVPRLLWTARPCSEWWKYPSMKELILSASK